MGGVGGFKRTCNELLTGFANDPPELDPKNHAYVAALRFQKGVIPDLMIETQSMDPSENFI